MRRTATRSAMLASAQRRRASRIRPVAVAVVALALAGGCAGSSVANVSRTASPPPTGISTRLRQGDEVIVAGVDPALHGTYRAHPVSSTEIDLDATRQGGASLKLSPHFSQLHDSRGRSVDLWSVCNVTVKGQFEFLAWLTVTHGNVLVTLDYG